MILYKYVSLIHRTTTDHRCLMVKSTSTAITNHYLTAKDLPWRSLYFLIVEPRCEDASPDEDMPFITTDKVLVPVTDIRFEMDNCPLNINIVAQENFYGFYGKVSIKVSF